MSLLAINKLYYSSEEGKTVLENISLSVGSGEIVILVGKSGAGKTLLLEIIYGTAAPLTGDVIFKGVAVSDLKLKKNLSLGRSIAYLPKTGILFHDRTVEENIEFYLSLNSFVKKDKSGKKLAILIETGLNESAAKEIASLSNFEKKKLALAIVGINQPELLLADSPADELEPHSSEQIVQYLQKVNKQGIAMLIATNNFEFAKNLRGKIFLLEEGKLKAIS
ncbi:MAG: ATP-binding cassette domain-containing protein [Ignavibacteriaceae bacterium]|nr:ATP-binding cassette domain-containing protein [Ignavibacteriaceae bacterium]